MKFFLSFIYLTILVNNSAVSQVIPDGDTVRIGKYIQVHALSEHLYRYICSNYETPSNGLIYADANEALLVDAPNGDGIVDSLVSWINKDLHAVLKGVVVTHWHEQDRMGGIDVINKLNIPTYCLQKTMKIAGKKNIPHPCHSFKDSLSLKIGNKSVLFQFAGAGHTKDNIVVWFPDEKVLFGGCLIKDNSAQELGYIHDADLKAWPATVRKLIQMFPDVKTVVPGHFNYGDQSLLYHTIELVEKQNQR